MWSSVEPKQEHSKGENFGPFKFGLLAGGIMS